MTFWIVVIILTLCIGGIAFYPLFSKKIKVSKETDLARDQLNKAFYFDRLKEVNNEISEGVIDDPQQTQMELQQGLLGDIPESSQAVRSAQKRTMHRGCFFALLLLLGGVSSAIYFSVGAWQSTDMMALSHQKLDYFYERIKTEETDPLSEQELNQFAMALRVELQQHPKDDKSWFMLGKIGLALDNGQMAFESFAKAATLQPSNSQYQIHYAQLLLFSEDPQEKMQGEEIVRTVLRQDHTNLEALSLLAFRSFEKEDYKMAAMTWGMMLKLMPQDSPRREVIERSMQSAFSMMSEQERQQLQKGAGK